MGCRVIAHPSAMGGLRMGHATKDKVIGPNKSTNNSN